MIDNDVLYQVALTRVPQIGDVHARILAEHFAKAEDIFRARRSELEKIEGIGPVRAHSIRGFSAFSNCEKELHFMERHSIRPLFITSADYPLRLARSYDAPALLYYKGTADLNAGKIISVVGTRNNSTYGKMLCETFLSELHQENLLVVSGLAFGIDTIAHETALRLSIPTVAVLAHGLDRIYPYRNKQLAARMLEQGGILSDFGHGTAPDRQHFPRRNRITAGICDALIVIESGPTGGSLITAELANSYHKDVFACPGRVTDPKSQGCNQLIRKNKATLITSAREFLEAMNWVSTEVSSRNIQRSLFPDLEPEEQSVVDILSGQDSVHLDHLINRLEMSHSRLSSLLLQLELRGILGSLPGKMYKLL